MMPELEFKSDVKFHPGINLTVRRGNKWAEYKEARIGGAVRAIYTEVLTFRDVGITKLTEHHDQNCRTPEGLFRELFHVYRYFSRDEKVTLVRFKI